MSLVTIFLALFLIGNLPLQRIRKSLIFRLIFHVGAKILLVMFLYHMVMRMNSGPNPTAFLFLNALMVLSVSFSLCAERYSRFFERTDLAQSIFLFDLFALKIPLENVHFFCLSTLLPYVAANIILISIGHFMEKQRGHLYFESFYNFFHEKKILASSAIVAMAFLAGVPPLWGLFWRHKSLAIFRPATAMTLTIIIACSLSYVYFKWILAILHTTNRAKITDGGGDKAISCFAALSAMVILVCKLFAQ